MNTFGNILLICCVMILLVSCSQPRYILVTDSELNSIIEKNNELPYKRYLVLPIDKYKNKTGVNDLLQKTYDLIKKEDYDSLNNFLLKYEDKSNGCQKYAGALSSQFQAKYPDALESVKIIDFDDCRCHAYLLRADSYSETSQNKGFNNLMKSYQEAVDCDDGDNWKLLVKTRIRLLRYEK